jgi:hypothetical protein
MKLSFIFGGFCLALGTAGCIDLETSTNSTGSGGSGGGSSSSSGGVPGTVIQEWRATEPTADTGYTLPTWLQIECGTGDRTSQWAPDMIKRPFASHAARPRNVGTGWGLSVESRRRNHLEYSDSWDGPNWDDPAPASAMTKVLGNPDPAGGNVAARFESSGMQRSVQAAVPLGYASAWFVGDNDASLAHFVVSIGDLGWRYRTLSGLPNWNRVSLGSGSGEFFLDTIGDLQSSAAPIPSPTTIHAYGAQHETDGNGILVKYPSSYIPTTGKNRLRSEDRLASNRAQELIPGGYFHAIVKFAPNYAWNEGTSLFHHVLFVNSTNAVRIELDKGKVTLLGTGNGLSGPTSGALTWLREQELTVEIVLAPKYRMLSVSGADEGNFSVSDTADTPWPSNGNVYILGDTGGAQECADLRYIGFFQPN